ncbi:MAG: hypothetical protein KGQ49_04915, partial [Verrucomicrobia bacterium]|nr:hypothetical protein [Verrucomicrobiota bacterium]
MQKLSPPDATALDWFFRNCAQSFGGYVLYGDKPMALEYLFAKEEQSLYFSEATHAKMKAFKILKEWSQHCEDAEYPILFCKYANTQHMILINRKAFVKTVNQNLPLFRYILGHKLTAEALLLELIKNQDHFYDVLQDNNTLIGILLGYGTHNSLIVSRQEFLLQQETGHFENFPFAKAISQAKPMLGFASIEEELQSLACFKSSRDLKDFSTFEIPLFGCEPDSEETTALLATYEKNREHLLTHVQQDNFMEKTLEKLFTTLSGKVRIPPLPKPSTFRLDDKKALSRQFAEIIVQDAKRQKPLLHAFLHGAADRERGIRMKPCERSEDACLDDTCIVE